MIYVLAERPFAWERIGFADGGPDEVERRRRSLQSGNPRQLIVLATIEGGRDVETSTHQRFSKHRIRRAGSREWFHYRDEVMDWVVSIKPPVVVKTGSWRREIERAPTTKAKAVSAWHQETKPLLPKKDEFEWRGRIRKW